MNDSLSDVAASLQPLLFSLAYRMLGSVRDAEDVVQEAFTRYLRAQAQGATIDAPKAYLSTVVTRLAIDLLRSARMRRETYVGQWLPEPLLTDSSVPDPAGRAEQADSLSMAFLLLLERLNPIERAVYLLHDVFDYDYDEIATIVGKSATNCRQLAVRARRHLEASRPRFDPSPAERDRLADRFFAAVLDGDVDHLISLIAADAAVYGDGGGNAPQWIEPVTDPKRIARLLANVGRGIRNRGLTLERRQVNAQPGAVMRDGEGGVVCVFSVDVRDGAVQDFRSVINPDKLEHLGPLADLTALTTRQR